MTTIIDPKKELREIQEPLVRIALDDIEPIEGFKLKRAKEGANGKELLLGIGINDSPYMTSYDYGMHVCPAHTIWRSMLQKAYDNSLDVCDEWTSFMSFREWFMTQDWECSYLDIFLIDPSASTIGPKSAVFVPFEFHTTLVTLRKWELEPAERLKANGLPIGVTFYKRTGKYQAKIRRIGGTKQEHIGYYPTVEAAKDAYDDALAENLELIIESIPESNGKLLEVVEGLIHSF